MAGTYAQLKSYIRTLCVNHVSIRHSSTEEHFFIMGMEEVLTKIRNSVNFPAVMLADYDYSFRDNRSDNILKNRSFALVFLNHCEDADDFDEIAEIYSDMESLADEFLNRMYDDKGDHRHAFLKDMDLASTNAVQFQAADNNFGVWLPIVATSTHNILVDNTKWLDL